MTCFLPPPVVGAAMRSITWSAKNDVAVFAKRAKHLPAHRGGVLRYTSQTLDPSAPRSARVPAESVAA